MLKSFDRPSRGARRRSLWRRRADVLRWRARRLDPAVRGLIWAVVAGLCFSGLNASMRALALEMNALQAQFLRYAMGIVVLAPMMLRAGLAACVPRSVPGQFVRGVVHTAGLSLWFLSIAHVSLADVTAIGFTGPLFTMLGAALFLGEKMRARRWVAAFIGLAGVLVVVAPQLQGDGGWWMLVLLGSTPFFAASFLITKAQTGYERPEVIVLWQAITVALLSLPMAVASWQTPSAVQWGLVLLGGLFGTASHYSITRAFSLTDISATQTVKFLDLVWASALGWLIFGNMPSQWTVIGGTVICASTLWIVRQEARAPRSRRL